MNLLTWLLCKHPFFSDTRQHLLDVLTQDNIHSFDDLVIQSRRPFRTVLLVLNELLRNGEAKITIDGIVSFDKNPVRLPRATVSYLNSMPIHLQERYFSLASRREEPALLWGQRRLVPAASIERAIYILSWMRRQHGRIALLGDDDLVSPLVAACAPQWDVHVVDIDKAVLQRAQQVASDLSGKLSTNHADLSQASLDHLNSCDIVVGDPFPSGDGSFEAMFWEHARQMLVPGGTLITTVAPSHKPPAYAMGALYQLHALDFCLVDLKADFGRYEVFDFELIPFEKHILSGFGLLSTVSHTKSLLAAEYAPSENRRISTPDFDFGKWIRGARTHYLTIQAGTANQLQIATERGLQQENAGTQQMTPMRGMQVNVIFPANIRKNLFGMVGYTSEDIIYSWSAILLQHLGVEADKDELEELAGLALTPEIKMEGHLAQLGLAIRAIESWERWRFDE